MECNNKFCMWNVFNQCCPEDQEQLDKAVPNTLDCPSTLRADHQTQLYTLVDVCNHLLRFRNMRELIEIKRFIEGQRK